MKLCSLKKLQQDNMYHKQQNMDSSLRLTCLAPPHPSHPPPPQKSRPFPAVSPQTFSGLNRNPPLPHNRLTDSACLHYTQTLDSTYAFMMGAYRQYRNSPSLRSQLTCCQPLASLHAWVYRPAGFYGFKNKPPYLDICLSLCVHLLFSNSPNFFLLLVLFIILRFLFICYFLFNFPFCLMHICVLTQMCLEMCSASNSRFLTAYVSFLTFPAHMSQ